MMSEALDASVLDTSLMRGRPWGEMTRALLELTGDSIERGLRMAEREWSRMEKQRKPQIDSYKDCDLSYGDLLERDRMGAWYCRPSSDSALSINPGNHGGELNGVTVKEPQIPICRDH
ncbi:uncharacterized protein H6S33_003369 [Morchella sextelata]|uniref:uncharacterized protein n=1 Tax=Morchella sextelata TaxID=1174677 RepID=UPI001D03F28D|nr:uncharacterized protein H6S33_003369 [Morchella sextelata]KAH0606535.1 hypothetical protein H6S33_003369 [Morchella sextelata]